MPSVYGDTFYDGVTGMSHTNFFPLSTFGHVFENFCRAATPGGPFGGQNF